MLNFSEQSGKYHGMVVPFRKIYTHIYNTHTASSTKTLYQIRLNVSIDL